MAYVGQRAYMLQQRMECRGLKVYDIDNVQASQQSIPVTYSEYSLRICSE